MAEERSPAEDERWLVVDGRRGRRTDPAIPDHVLARLTSHLGRGRSGVRTAASETELSSASSCRLSRPACLLVY